jgi:hypothetical protein
LSPPNTPTPEGTFSSPEIAMWFYFPFSLYQHYIQKFQQQQRRQTVKTHFVRFALRTTPKEPTLGASAANVVEIFSQTL